MSALDSTGGQGLRPHRTSTALSSRLVKQGIAGPSLV